MNIIKIKINFKDEIMYFLNSKYLNKSYYIKLTSGADHKLALAYNPAT